MPPKRLGNDLTYHMFSSHCANATLVGSAPLQSDSDRVEVRLLEHTNAMFKSLPHKFLTESMALRD